MPFSKLVKLSSTHPGVLDWGPYGYLIQSSELSEVVSSSTTSLADVLVQARSTSKSVVHRHTWRYITTRITFVSSRQEHNFVQDNKATFHFIICTYFLPSMAPFFAIRAALAAVLLVFESAFPHFFANTETISFVVTLMHRATQLHYKH